MSGGIMRRLILMSLLFSSLAWAQGEVGGGELEQGTVAPPGSPGSPNLEHHEQMPQAAPSQQNLPQQNLSGQGMNSQQAPAGQMAPAPQAQKAASAPQPQPQFQPGPVHGGALSNEPFNYDPAGRRDPFRPYRLVKPGAGGKDQVIVLEPLQTFDLEQLVILGILWDVHQPRALIQAPDGSLHTVVTRSKIGKNDGYVAAIREGEIVVIESFEEGERIIKRTQVMEFKK